MTYTSCMLDLLVYLFFGCCTEFPVYVMVLLSLFVVLFVVSQVIIPTHPPMVADSITPTNKP